MRERKPLRLHGRNYSIAAHYFVTCCCKNREPVFGVIDNGRMIVNRWGEIAQEKWFQIPNHFGNVRLDSFVVMPNHVHGIIYLGKSKITEKVGDRHACPLQPRPYQRLPVIVGSYKSAVTRFINKVMDFGSFQWQRSYHDRIIRSRQELMALRNYIRLNPPCWDQDEENPILTQPLDKT